VKFAIFHFHLLNFYLQFNMLNLPKNIFCLIYTGGCQLSEKHFVYTTFEEMEVIFPYSYVLLLLQLRIVFHSFTILTLIAAFAIDSKYVVFVGANKGEPQTLNIVQHTCDLVNQVLSQTFRDS